MTLRLHRMPWSRFCGATGIELKGDLVEVDGGATLAMRLVGSAQSHREFQINGEDPVVSSHGGHVGEDHYAFALPNAAGAQDRWSLRIGSRRVDVVASGLPPRKAKAEREGDPREQWLLWQSACYRMLSDHALDARLHRDVLGASGGDASGLPVTLVTGEADLPGGGARRRWETVRDRWQEDRDAVAIMSLVAQFSRDKELLRAMRSIAANPRRMLVRTHRPRKVHRVSEMDIVTMRAFARAPGRTAIQKAGAKQELLAVVREETVDLPENRVLVWVAGRMDEMSRAWMSRYASGGSQGLEGVAKLVGELRRLARRVLDSADLADIKVLAHHMTSPTYCLQFDRRYRQIWKAYVGIRRQDRQRNDAFRWQSHLWGTTARLLLTSVLLQRDSEGWSEVQGVSTPYFRGDPEGGEWLEGPSIPGPFDTGDGLCHMIDLRRPPEESSFPLSQLPDEVCGSGADLVLVWPDLQRICPVWTSIGHRADGQVLESKSLSSKLRELSDGGSWGWSGLVMQAEPYAAKCDWTRQEEGGRLVLLHIPEDVRSKWDDMSFYIREACKAALQ